MTIDDQERYFRNKQRIHAFKQNGKWPCYIDSQVLLPNRVILEVQEQEDPGT